MDSREMAYSVSGLCHNLSPRRSSRWFHILIDPYRSPFWLILDDAEKISMRVSNFFRYQRCEDSRIVCRQKAFAHCMEALGLEP